MRVIHVIPAVAPRYGGPSEMVIGICRHLNQRGHQATILTTDADGAGELPVRYDEMSAYRGVESRFFHRRWSESFKFAPGMARWLKANIDNYDIAHIHAIFSWSTVVAGRICLASEVPYVLRPLGSLDPWSLSQRRWRKQLLMQAVIRRLLLRAASIHYTSELERQNAESALGLTNGRVVANAVAIPQDSSRPFIQPDPAFDRYLLYLGRLHPKKKLEWVIKSFASVAETPFRLVIAGDGEPRYRRTLEKLARSSGAADRIVFEGWVTGDRKERLLRGCQALLLISESENFGNTVAEAMARGRPVVVNEGVNIHPDIRRYGAGWVVSSRNSALTTTLAEVIRNRDERLARGRNARNLAERLYGWEAITDAMEAMYIDCLSGRPA